MKILKSLFIFICLLLTFGCSHNSETEIIDIVTQPSSILGTYCLNFSLVDSKMIIQQVSGGYSISIEDFDGGLNSGTGTASFTNNVLNIEGSFTIDSGTGNFEAALTYEENTESFSGSFNVLNPQNGSILITSSFNATKGSCNYSLSPNDLGQIIGQPLLTAQHVELNKIQKISRYRSAAGHNFVDYSGESCVNLKHYFHTYADAQVTNTTQLPSSLDYFAPADGTIVTMTQTRTSVDPTDYEIDIQLDANPNVIVRLFHITPNSNLSVGDHVSSGQQIAVAPSNHIDSGDFAVYVLTNAGFRHISMFEIMSSSVLQDYYDKGVNQNWRQDLYYETNNPYVGEIFCENGTWGNLMHPSSNWELDFYIFN